MPAIRRVFIFFTLVLSALFLSLTTANAQTAVDYHFLEVVDTAGSPVVNATVESIGAFTAPLKTDGNGVVRDFPVYYGDSNTRGFKISNPGYLTYESKELHENSRYWSLLDNEIPQYDPKKIRVVLLRTPNTPAEREAVEVEQRRRELIQAVKGSDSETVQKLLLAGVSADTTDVRGIPAILWAAASGNSKTINALLASRADVRNKHGSGRKALLYYLDSHTDKTTIDGELIKSLMKAGADVNAVNKRGETALLLARRLDNAEIIKMLEKAGAREPAKR